jgi:hypothetical protein
MTLIRASFSVVTLFALVIWFLTSAMAETQAPPTNERDNEPKALSPFEGKLALGFPEKLAKLPMSTGKEFYFTIMDSGFKGIHKWMEAHPEMKGRVEYFEKESEAKSSHGFSVFKVAHAIMPQAKFLLLRARNEEETAKAIDIMRKKGSYFASKSSGTLNAMGTYDPSKYQKWLKELEKHQITMFLAAANHRGKSHSFRFNDRNKNGFIEFTDNEEMLEENPVLLPKGFFARFKLSWTQWPKNKSDIELQLLKDGKVVTSQKSAIDQRPSIVLNYKSDETGLYHLRVKATRIYGADDLSFALFADNIGTWKGVFNGRQSLSTETQYESPFLISVGSFGLNQNGRIEPSVFSSIGSTYLGEISPHILGPGQVNLDGETLDGTSFSTPYIAALYANYATQNIKNVIEATSGHEFYQDGLVAAEKGRWGTPQFGKLFDNRCSGSEKIENLSYETHGEILKLNFDFSRNCMEKLDYWLHVEFKGEKHLTSKVVSVENITTRINEKVVPVKGWVAKKSESVDVIDEPITVEVPLKYFARTTREKSLTPVFKISTRAQWEPLSLQAKLRPDYTIILPPSEPMPAVIVGIKALETAKEALGKGAYREAVELSKRALVASEVTGNHRVNAYQTLMDSYIALGDMAKLLEASDSAIRAGFNQSKFLLIRGWAKFVSGDELGASADFNSCLDAEDSEELYSCSLSKLIANGNLDERSLQEVANDLGNDLNTLSKERDIHAQSLAMFLNRWEPNKLLNRAKQLGKNQEEHVLNFTAAYFYLGQLALLSDDESEAKDRLEQSSNSGGINLERALARHWLKSMPEEKVIAQKKPKSTIDPSQVKKTNLAKKATKTETASKRSYFCNYNGESDLGERISFDYDVKRNTVLLQEHNNGGYRPNFTLGDVIQENDHLNFSLEFWKNGVVVMRDEHSLDLTGMSLDSNRDFYSDGGEIFVNGPTIRANCVIVNNSQVREDQAGTASKSIDKLTQNYVCDYGGLLDFSYDSKRNTILLHEHHEGNYDVNFTLGTVDREGGMLQFDLEFWDKGSVVIRESHSLELEAMTLTSGQVIYDAAGEVAAEGKTSNTLCLDGSDAAELAPEMAANTKNTQNIKVDKSNSDTNSTSDASDNQQPNDSRDIICHIHENRAEGPKSATYCLNSQLSSQKEYTYGPENLAQADGAWCEGDPGQGIGASVELSFQSYAGEGQTPAFDRLLISNGYDRTSKTFTENSRVKKIEIKSHDAFGGQTWVRTLRDETGVQEVLLGSEVSPYGILITILEVYPGQKYEDTCLSFLSADFGF